MNSCEDHGPPGSGRASFFSKLDRLAEDIRPSFSLPATNADAVSPPTLFLLAVGFFSTGIGSPAKTKRARKRIKRVYHLVNIFNCCLTWNMQSKIYLAGKALVNQEIRYLSADTYINPILSLLRLPSLRRWRPCLQRVKLRIWT